MPQSSTYDAFTNTKVTVSKGKDFWNDGRNLHGGRLLNDSSLKKIFGTEKTPPTWVIDLAETPVISHRASTAAQQAQFERPFKPGKMHSGVKLQPKKQTPIIKLRERIVRSNNRPRTGSPVKDGLVGVEPNPGPPRQSTKTITIKRKIPKQKRGLALAIGGRRTLSTTMNYGGYGTSRVQAPIATGLHSSRKNNHFSFVGKGQANVLGSPAHIFTGRCAVQNVATGPGSTLTFLDGAGNLSPFMYLNPRICCQNSAYSVPQGNCPIGVIAQPFRKYSFRSLKLHYEPTSTSTTLGFFVAAMFDPEVIASSSLPATQMAFANFEASAYGPVWAPWTLDLTKWIDRSKWYFGETPGTIATSLIAGQAIQGTVQLCANAGAAASTIYGLMIMEFELALSELGPTEVFSAPAVKAEVLLSKDESKEEKSEPESPGVMVEENPLTRSIHIPQSYLRSLLGKSEEKHA